VEEVKTEEVFVLCQSRRKDCVAYHLREVRVYEWVNFAAHRERSEVVVIQGGRKVAWRMT
jgi:hypothetical protein